MAILSETAQKHALVYQCLTTVDGTLDSLPRMEWAWDPIDPPNNFVRSNSISSKCVSTLSSELLSILWYRLLAAAFAVSGADSRLAIAMKHNSRTNVVRKLNRIMWELSKSRHKRFGRIISHTDLCGDSGADNSIFLCKQETTAGERFDSGKNAMPNGNGELAAARIYWRYVAPAKANP